MPEIKQDLRAATLIVAADDSLNKNMANYVCDGTADEVEIQAAIDALPAQGGTVLLLEGIYTLSAGVSIVNNYISLRGMGPGATQLQWAAGVQANMITISASGCGVHDLRVYAFTTAGDLGNEYNQNGIFVTNDTNIPYRTIICNVEANYAKQSGIKTKYAYRVFITDCLCYQNGNTGVDLRFAYRATVKGCILINNTNAAVGATSGSDIAIANNYCENSAKIIRLYLIERFAVVGNVARTGGRSVSLLTCSEGSVVGNSCNPLGVHTAIYLNDCDYVNVNSNEVANASYGILLGGPTGPANHCTVNGNQIRSCQYAGISIQYTSTHIVIDGNEIYGCSLATDVTYPGIWMLNCEDCLVQNNMVRRVGSGNEQNYGILLTVNALRTIVKNNDLRNSGKTAPFSDGGVDTILPVVSLQFVDGTAFISAGGSAKGWEIDLANEYAIALGQLPLEVTQVVRIKLWAVGLAAPGAGNHMNLEININAGQDDEAYTAEAIAIATKPSVTENFAINDVIHWMIDPTDDADIGDLVGGDSVEVKVLHDAAGVSDIATDAVFRRVDIEYVS